MAIGGSGDSDADHSGDTSGSTAQTEMADQNNGASDSRVEEERKAGFEGFNETVEVRKSEISGMGLFAKRLIPKGTVWWAGYAGRNVLLLSREQMQMFCDQSLLNEGAANGSTSSITIVYSPGDQNDPMAMRDIQPGEITEDYGDYAHPPWRPRPEPSYYTVHPASRRLPSSHMLTLQAVCSF